MAARIDESVLLLHPFSYNASALSVDSAAGDNNMVDQMARIWCWCQTHYIGSWRKFYPRCTQCIGADTHPLDNRLLVRKFVVLYPMQMDPGCSLYPVLCNGIFQMVHLQHSPADLQVQQWQQGRVQTWIPWWCLFQTYDCLMFERSSVIVRLYLYLPSSVSHRLNDAHCSKQFHIFMPPVFVNAKSRTSPRTHITILQ